MISIDEFFAMIHEIEDEIKSLRETRYNLAAEILELRKQMKDSPKHHVTAHCDKWDSCYESNSGIWLEKACGDKNCYFRCTQRPFLHSVDCECLKEGDDEQ